MEVHSEKEMDNIAFAPGPAVEGKPEVEGGLRFVGRPIKQAEQEHVIRSTILEEDPILNYPKVGDTAYNEFTTPYLGSMAFPHRFPGGYGDPWAPDRPEPVKLQHAAQHLLHFRHGTQPEYYYPFAEDKLFICWIGNMIARHKTIEQVAVYMNKHEIEKDLTREQLVQMAETLAFEKLVKRVGAYVSNVMMTPEYWFSQRKKLLSLQESIGGFDAFLTWSYCNLYDPYLHRLYQHPPHTGELTMAMRAKVKKKVPHLVTAWITERMDVLRDQFVFGVMNAKIFWSREEWQARGEKHRHGLAKHDMELNHVKNADIAVLGKFSELVLKSGDYAEHELPLLKERVEAGIVAEGKVIRAVDLLVTCMHPDVRSLESVWTLPNPHPCTRFYANVIKNFDAASRADHEKDLWNVCGRHRKCNSYCLREGKCRFHFGDDSYKPLIDETRVVYDITYPKDKSGEVDDSKAPLLVKLRLQFRRNDKYTVDINEAMFFGNGFNSDFKVVVDRGRARTYATKYSVKAPIQSKAYEQAIQNVLKYTNASVSGKSCVTKTFLKSHGGIDRSPAEWCHFINSNRTCDLKYRDRDGKIANLKMVRVSLMGGKRINMEKTDTDGVRKPTDIVSVDSIVDAYARRRRRKDWCSSYPEIKKYNLDEFVREFAFFPEADVLHKRKLDIFTSYYPRGSANYKARVAV